MVQQRDRHFDVVSIGEILVDFVAPDAEDLPSATTFVRAAGGAPANVAVAAARLGAHSAFVGAIGADPFGAYLRSVLSVNGVDVSTVRTVPERTTLAFVAKNRGGIPDFVFYRGADMELSPDELPRDVLMRSTFVHVSSMALLTEPSGSATHAAVKLAHEGGALVSIDPNLRPSSWPSFDGARRAIEPLLAAADVLKVNDEEAHRFAGTSDLARAADILGEDRRLVVITLGGEGCHWSWQGRSGTVSSPAVDVVDTTGAGDAFVGALLAELCTAGYGRERFSQLTVSELEQAVRFACAAGAFSCTQTGAMPSLPRRPDVERLL